MIVAFNEKGLEDILNTTLVNRYTHKLTPSLVTLSTQTNLRTSRSFCDHQESLFYICYECDWIGPELNKEVKDELVELGSLV